MTNIQLYLAIGVPMLFNAALAVALFAGLKSHMDSRFDAVDKRFDDMRDLWRAELYRASEVMN
jgi:hypothetical protein